jgi:hypothetical protein|tara:strand:+ start:605 stop:1222 length:618 start_codon:yes stop_codon:yes gene_type:complete
MPATSYAAGLATSLLFATNGFWGDVPAPRVALDKSFLSEWIDDGTEPPPCAFYNGSYRYSGGLCSHLAIARMSATTQQEALSRALACAAHYETDCLLSPEVGFSVPAAFVYDEDAGLRMLVAPKLVPMPMPATPPGRNVTEKLVGFQDPRTDRSAAQLRLHSAINAEYQPGATRGLATAVLDGSAAYCVQMLRLAFDEDCWKQID